MSLNTKVTDSYSEMDIELRFWVILKLEFFFNGTTNN